MSKNLKPCPFCEGPAIYDWYEHHSGEKRVRVICLQCAASVDSGWWQSETMAREAWNRRVNE